MALVDHQLLKRGISQLQVPLLVSLPLDPTQKQFFENLVFYIPKGYYPLNSIQNVWLKRLVKLIGT